MNLIRAVGLALLLACQQRAMGLDVTFRNQASSWLIGRWDTTWYAGAGLRDLPQLTLDQSLGKVHRLAAELSLNGQLNAGARAESLGVGIWIKPYRAWLRYSTERFDLRAGLQKINFGSATLLRPLMWFDRIDPRDPLQMTDGVYALLGRYYFPGEVNIWAWGLLGNDSTKGWEQVPTEAWKPEPGGRVQVPVPRGEIAATYHYRQAYWPGVAFPEQALRYFEHRVGLDGRWDVGIGLAFEAVVTSSRSEEGLGWGWLVPPWQHAVTVGADYTIPLGNGLGLLAEHMFVNGTDRVFKFNDLYHLTAATVNYPLGLLDQMRLMAVYDWRNQNWYRYLSWQRTYDNWIFGVAGFWNPTQNSVGASPMGGNRLAGAGLQLMVVFDH